MNPHRKVGDFSLKDTMKFTFIDLFAGIGGFHEAAKELGGHCVFASEIDKYACITYEANHGTKPHGDITKIDAQDIPDHDILFGGFPCQAFSVAGKRLGFEDTRGTLFFEIARILKEKQPKMFLLENVKGLKNHDNGKTLAVILDTLFSLGYIVNHHILNAKDYGVPQNRQRIFIVGTREPIQFKWPIPEKAITLSEFFNDEFDRDISHTIRSGGRSSGINNKHNWDTYKLKNGFKKLTPRECARLQGFPDSFVIPVSNAQAYKQFGNAVCVKVVKAILSQLFLV